MEHKYYYYRYKLLIDLPTGQKSGDIFHSHVSNDGNPEIRFYHRHGKSIYNDYDSMSFTLDQVSDERFFKPIGEKYDFIVSFPTKEDIKEYYYLIGESRLVASVDQVRLIEPIFQSEEFYNGVYNLLRDMYNKKYYGR